MDAGFTLGTQAVLPLVVGAVLGAVVVALVGLRGAARRSRRDRAIRAELAEVRRELAEVRRRLDAPAPTAQAEPREPREYVITTMPHGRHGPEEPDRPAAGAQPLTSGQFASVAVGESLVTLVSLGHGVRRALSAENRNRIAFEMRREVRRARKQRRRELKQARRNLREAAA